MGLNIQIEIENERDALRMRVAELETRLKEVAHAYDVTFKRRVELESAILDITHRDSASGAICNSYVEDADLREYAPILETVHTAK